MYEMIAVVNDILPTTKPRYLMGVGTPWNILNAIELGVDQFDCVMPTRNGRNGQIFTWQGVMNMRNKKWEDDFSELDPTGTSYVDHEYTRAYVRHLIHAEEMLGLDSGRGCPVGTAAPGSGRTIRGSRPDPAIETGR